MATSTNIKNLPEDRNHRADPAALTAENTTHFSADASDVGLKPGQWPKIVRVLLDSDVVFVAKDVEKDDGELSAVVYHEWFGSRTLTLYND